MREHSTRGVCLGRRAWLWEKKENNMAEAANRTILTTHESSLAHETSSTSILSTAPAASAGSLNPGNCRVALLAGGRSKEREVSLASGVGARQALEEAGFQVDQIDPASKEGLVALIEGDYDVAFLCLHGRFGEDGLIQGFLEMIDLPYTGSDVLASALAMNKTKTKAFYEQAGIKTPASMTVDVLDDITLGQIAEVVGIHCVVKPPEEGSSFGVSIVDGKDELRAAVGQSLASDGEALVEAFVEGRELTVSVLGNKDVDVLPVVEIIPKSGFYDFEAKYTQGGSDHVCPAELTAEENEEVQRLAEKAHRVLGCSGFSRSDFILDNEGCFWALETNTIPGMTATSLLPEAARVAGIDLPELYTKLIVYALEDRKVPLL